MKVDPSSAYTKSIARPDHAAKRTRFFAAGVALGLSIAFAPIGQANPTGGQVVSGTANIIKTAPDQLDIHQST
ncbi:MAG: hypothetical protein ACR2RL_01595, partial [Gammaproteobacteria bacterium]